MKIQFKVKNYFQIFAGFLIKEHLSDLSVQVLARIRFLDLPILKLLSRYTEEQILALLEERWSQFLLSVVNGNELEDVERRIKEWQTQKTIITVADFTPMDISYTYSAQKYCLLKKLVSFTQDIAVYNDLVLSIEDFYTQANKLIFTAYLEYQKESLIREKEFVETIVDNSPDEILAFDKELKLIAWNKRLEENLGILKESVLGKHIFEIFPHYENTEEGVKFLEVLKGLKVSFPSRYFPARKKYIQMNIVPLLYKGEIIGGLTLVRDLTEFNEIEVQLLEREKFISNITASIPQLIYVFDLIEQKNLYINRSAVSYLGYTEEQIKQMGDDILDIVMHPDEREMLAAHFKRVADSPEGSVHGYEYRMKHSDGSWKWFYCNDTLFKRNENGKAWQVLGTSQDITEKKKTELQIFRSEKISKEVQAMAHIGHYEWYAESNTVQWSEEMFRIYGYEPGELVLDPVMIDSVTIPSESREYRNQLLKKLYLSPGSYDYEHKILKKDGSKGIISGKVVSYADAKGNLIKVTGYAQDVTEKFVAEQQLKEKEHFNQMLTQSSPNLIFVYDLTNYSFVYGNKSIEEFLGCPVHEIAKLGQQTVQTLIHPEDTEKVQEHLQKISISQTAEVFIVEYRLKDHKGEYKWIRSHETVFKRDKSGKPVLGIGNSQDVTLSKETKRALAELNAHLEQRIKTRTQELEQSRKQISLIIDSIPALISYVDQDQRYAYVNKTYTLWHQKESGSFVGKTIQEVCGEQMYPSIEPHVIEVLQGKEIYYDATLQYASGIKSVQISYIPDIGDSGDIKGFVVLVLDISNQKNLEKELRQREKELRLITDSVPASISYIDREQKYTFANKASVLLNRKGERLLGMTVSENLGKKYREIQPYLIKCLEGHFVSYDTSYQYQGRQKHMRIQFIPDVSESGETKGFVSLIIDITEDKRKENELKTKNNELIKINADLDNFIYTASHDLKAPVSNIEGLIYSLAETLEEEQKLNKDVTLVIQMMKESVLRFQGIISDLTDIIKIQRNTGEDIEQINLKDMISEIGQDLSLLIRESQAEIRVNLNNASVMRFSKVNMRSILHNLISNAIKYRSHERNSLVEISSRELDMQFVLEVRDNGLGIKNDQKEKVFQMFKRLHNHVEGTGIGLYIVKRIVENAGGKIELESQAGKGSLFRILIPVMDHRMLKNELPEQ